MLCSPINLAIVDDHSIFRKTLKTFLTQGSGFRICIESERILDFLDKLSSVSVHCDVLLLDLYLPEINGNDAIRMIREKCSTLKIIVLSMNEDIEIISGLLEEGIHGYISKADEPEDLLKAIQAVSEGRMFRNKHLTEALYWDKQNQGRIEGERAAGTLSDREKKIIQLIWEEKSNKEISEMLFIGIRSVEKIRQDMKEKVGAKSTIGLMKYAIDKKIIFPYFQNNPNTYTWKSVHSTI